MSLRILLNQSIIKKYVIIFAIRKPTTDEVAQEGNRFILQS